MALTLTIGGSDFKPQYKTNSAVIDENLENRGNTLSLELTKLPSQSKPDEAKEIIFKDGSRFLFAGYVSRMDPVEVGEGQLFVYRLEATDYTYILINHNAQKTYENQTLKAIVEDLISTYASGYSLTTTNVDTGPTIEKVAFNHISLRKCFEKLAAISGFEWWIDYEKNIYFKPRDYAPAPESFTDSSDNFEAVNIQTDVTQVRNSIVVKGGREETTTALEEEIPGDGLKRSWPLREKPKTMVSLEFDDNGGGGYATKSYGVDPIDEEGSNFFMFNFQEKYVRVTTATATPTSAQKIKATYYYEVPVIVKLKSTLSIAAMTALEGGDGLHEFVITDPSIKSKAEARSRALQELENYANPLINATIRTRTGLLSAGSYFKPGQELTINMPTWGISSDSKYLIQAVKTSLSEDGSNIEYHYQIRFGGRLLNAARFLEQLAGKEEVIDATEEIDRIEAVQENLSIAETIERDSNAQETTDTLTIVETVTEREDTPPFLWGGPEAQESYSEANQDTSHELDPSSNTFRGQTIQPSLDYKITSARFYLKKQNSPTGNVYVEVYAMGAGTHGTDGRPSDSSTPLATSDPVAASGISSSFELVEFTFSDAQRIILSSGSYYCLVLRYEDGDGTNLVVVGEDGSSPTAPGNRCYSPNGTNWFASSSPDLCYYLYGNEAPAMAWGLFEWS